MTDSVSLSLVREARATTFDDLPGEVVQQAKNLILNALGSGMMGHLVEPGQIVERAAMQSLGQPESTIWGSGLRTSFLWAAMSNVAKVANTGHWDKCYYTPEGTVPLGANRGLIPALLTAAQKERATAKDAITAIVVGYETANKIMDALGGMSALKVRKWSPDTVARPCALAIAAARLFTLSEEQTVNALGIAGCFGQAPRVVTSATAKHHLRSPVLAFNALLAVTLARAGYPGPTDVLDGDDGLNEVLFSGTIDLEKLRQPRNAWSILYTGVNRTSVDGDVVGPVEAALELVIEHDLRPEDVESVVVRTNPYQVKYQGDRTNPELLAPPTREVAVHSMFYATAAAILYRSIGFDEFLEERFLALDPRLTDLIERISAVPEPKYANLNQSGSAEIVTRDGRRFTREVLHPKGLHPMNQMTAGEHEDNFRDMAGRVIPGTQVEEIVHLVRELEAVEDLERLIEKLVVLGGD
jgi:2-methylcitrate dehydratase